MKRKTIPQTHIKRWRKYKTHRENFDATEFKIDTTKIDDLLLSKPKEYQDKVNELIEMLSSYAKSDPIDPIKPGSYSYEGFDIPHHTHQLIKYKCKIFEIWSKDIDRENRLKYQIKTGDVEGNKVNKIIILQIDGHEDNFEIKYESLNVNWKQKLFSEEILAEREKWIQEHAHMSKTSQRILMPLHLKYPDIQPFNESFKQALEKAEQQRLKTVRKEPVPEPEPLTIKLLYENNIKGTLFERRHDKPWKVITR